MKKYPFNDLVRFQIKDYFDRMRYRVIHDQYLIYCNIFDEFKGYIRALYALDLIDEKLYDRLFDIGNNMAILYIDKGVC